MGRRMVRKELPEVDGLSLSDVLLDWGRNGHPGLDDNVLYLLVRTHVSYLSGLVDAASSEALRAGERAREACRTADQVASSRAEWQQRALVSLSREALEVYCQLVADGTDPLRAFDVAERAVLGKGETT